MKTGLRLSTAGNRLAESVALQEQAIPIRRPAADRTEAPLPPGWLRRPNRGVKRVVLGSLAAMNRAVHPLPLGHWLRRRLERGRIFNPVDVRLGRAGPQLHGLRIAFLSDFHAGAFMDEVDLRRIFAAVARHEPDMVCLGGDLIEDRPEQILLFRKAIGLVRPPLGIFAVPGNHDYDADPELQLWTRALTDFGVTVLCNAGQRVSQDGESLWLAGVDDLTRGKPDLPAALADMRHEEPALLLSHHPDLFQEAHHVGVDLTLSGHTHAGQITLFGRTPFTHSRLGYWRGRYERDGAQLYVGRGTGTTGLPIRIHASAEVPLVRILTGL
jgi:predicted MPP superfamily phosphohydrolase